jgi:Cys-rich protein (TIGR01571 family)
MGWITISLLVQVAFAVLYSRVVVEPLKDQMGDLSQKFVNSPDGGDFNVEMCGCYKNPWVCIQGLCCPMVRIAHTNAVSGVCPFWESLMCWCCCSWLTVNIGPFCLLIWWRLRLKNIMKAEENALNDFCITMFCPLISLCQMSTAVDEAMGYKVTGLCEYTPYSYGGPADSLN